MKRFLLWYFLSFIIGCTLSISAQALNKNSLDGLSSNSFGSTVALVLSWQFWLVLCLPYLLYRVGFYFNQLLKSQSNLTVLSRYSFSIMLPVGLLLSIFSIVDWPSHFLNKPFSASISHNSDENSYLNKSEIKHRGAHVFGYLDSMNIKPYIKNNYDWITLVAYGDQKDFDSPTMQYYKGDSIESVQRKSRWEEQISIAHSHGFKVFLKPHIWIYKPTDGKWRSDIYPANDENWKLWQKNYREFILMYAQLAEENEVELFCIGVELTRLSTEKSEFWRALIKEVRAVYSGKLTYAANWYYEFEKVPFWDDLDYIGIQAYFPLVKNEHPTVHQISKGWNKHLPGIESIYKKYNRKVIFTEMGYKSTSDSAIKPWEWIDYSAPEDKSLSTETQAFCYQAFFNSVWKKDWLAGVHIWQTRSDYLQRNNFENKDFTPQGKPAEDVIARGFEKTENQD